MRIKDKQAWIKIIEAFIAILLISSVVFVLITAKQNNQSFTKEQAISLQKFILWRISLDPELRTQIIMNDISGVNKVLNESVPDWINYYSRICVYKDICALRLNVEGDVFSDDVLITGNLTHFDSVDPKKLKLFFWTVPWPEPVCNNSVCEPSENDSDKFPSTYCQDDCRPLPQKKPDMTLEIGYLNYGVDYIYYYDRPNKIHYYNSTRTFTSLNGFNITLTSGQLCFRPGAACQTSTPKTLPNPYKIDYNNNYILRFELYQNHSLNTKNRQDIFNLTYWGTADNNVPVMVQTLMCSDMESIAPC